MSYEEIADNLRRVQDQIAAAAERAGRDAAEVTLVVVTKTRGLDEVRAAVAAGAVDLGENYVQEMEAKAQALAHAEVRWHAIGHLQTNKVRKVAPFVSLVHSVDSARVARELDARASAGGRRVPFLLQVNVSGEDSKFGVGVEAAEALALEVRGLTSARLVGLMTMPPYVEDPEANRPHFQRLREVRERLVAAGVPEADLRQLSMGMSGDFAVAVEEGATLVRVGTAIFGSRH